MSLEQQIASLVEASNNLTGAVNGKIGQIDQRLTQAEQEFDQFVATADERYKTHLSQKITVGGEWGKFYPVRIELRGGPVNKLNIYRANLFENQGNINGLDPSALPGTFTLSLLTVGDAWGHRIPFSVIDTYHHKEHRFLGDVVSNYKYQAVWVWLRGGGVAYYITHDSLALSDSKVKVFTEETSDQSGLIGIYLSGHNHPDKANYQPKLEADINVGLPASGYIRGVA
ncbi:hypothetical protein [Vibrio parahaemolyticus]|uniref:hypothetical protein n=1 Tax=Vibrio parahaemolyticus TaxID=670 RepID=UPI000A1F56FC|nr:hypothetical protein [Vibrio parahaemolyticus]